MKKYLFVLLLIFVVLCSCSNKKNCIKEITIRKVDREIFTPVRISCDSFEQNLSNEFVEIKLTDKNILSKFENLIANLVVDSTSVYKSMDVRMQVDILYYDNKNSKLCISFYPREMAFNSNTIKFSQKTIVFLDSLISVK